MAVRRCSQCPFFLSVHFDRVCLCSSLAIGVVVRIVVSEMSISTHPSDPKSEAERSSPSADVRHRRISAQQRPSLSTCVRRCSLPWLSGTLSFRLDYVVMRAPTEFGCSTVMAMTTQPTHLITVSANSMDPSQHSAIALFLRTCPCGVRCDDRGGWQHASVSGCTGIAGRTGSTGTTYGKGGRRC